MQQQPQTAVVAEKPDAHRVQIYIDNEPRISPPHTTGSALYALGHVRPHYELLAERKRGDDIPIPNNASAIEVKEGERFHSVPIDLNPGAR